MIDVHATVVGAERVVQRLQDSGAGARDRVRSQVQALGLELLRKVKEEQLTGEALNVRSGRLRRSVNERTEVNGDDITSSTGTNVVYGAAWELGFDRLVGPGARGGFKATKHSKAAAAVKKHYEARPFLQPALAEMRNRVLEQLSKAVL